MLVCKQTPRKNVQLVNRPSENTATNTLARLAGSTQARQSEHARALLSLESQLTQAKGSTFLSYQRSVKLTFALDNFSPCKRVLRNAHQLIL